MEDLLKSIKTESETLSVELEKFATGNKAAGVRARKATLVLEKLYKEFRKTSVKHD